MDNRKMPLKRILFVLDGYPSETSNACTFARALIVAIADMGVECVVVAPQIIKSNTLKQRLPYTRLDTTPRGNTVRVYMPYYLHLSSRPISLGFSMNNHMRAVLKVIKRHNIDVGAIYGHFIYQCGLTAARVGEKLRIPPFVAVGESDKLEPGNTRCRGAYDVGKARYHWREILDTATGIICVTERTKQLLLSGGFVSPAKAGAMGVFPNGVDTDVFRRRDRSEIRKQLGIADDLFIVAYVGAFNDNKGAQRLSAALDMFDDAYSFFIGRGNAAMPSCEHRLYTGELPFNMVAVYLAAADVFVLPTRSEGSCNAIIEALACGLPVISSNKPFNDGILTDDNSIRIDSDDVGQIYTAIKKLKEDPKLRLEMSDSAYCTGHALDINKRAELIFEYIKELGVASC